MLPVSPLPCVVGRGDILKEASIFLEHRKALHRRWDVVGELHRSELLLGPLILFLYMFLIIWEVGGGTKII